MSTLKEYGVIAAFIFACCLIVLLSVPVMGLVVSQSWNWFLAPIAGLRAISLTEGIGLSFFLGIVGTIITLPLRKWESDDKPGDSPGMILVRAVLKMAGLFVFGPLAALSGAWVWHTFIISPPGH
jgi:hypothetical protein